MKDREDRLIEAVARELKRPVSLDPALNSRTMAEIRRPPVPVHRTAGAKWAGFAIAAGVAGFAALAGHLKSQPDDQRISFIIEAPGASRVSLVGDFNNWDPAATPLERVSSGGKWRAIVPLDPGRYEFTYVVDGTRWVADPGAPRATGDDFGHPTSVITVTASARS